MTNPASNETTYLFATIDSLTNSGGCVITATVGSAIAGLDMARVGDVVTYPAGSEQLIIDGNFVPVRLDGLVL